MNILSTSFHSSTLLVSVIFSLQILSLSAQYSSLLSILAGDQTRSPVSGSVSAENQRGRCGGALPSSRALRVARWSSSCLFFSIFACSYLPSSNARWSGRRRQSVGQRYGFSVSLGQSLRVIANGVRLNGAGGFSELRQRRINSGVCNAAFTETSG